MAVTSSARRYAQAVFGIAKEHGNIEKWRDDLGLLCEVLSVPELLDFVSSPRIRFAEKQSLLETHLATVSQEARNLAFLLVRRGRTYQMGEILKDFEEMMDAQNGVISASVTTAVPLDAADEARVRALLEKQMGQDLHITVHVDPAIIGGLVARVGDKVLDGSTRTRLREMREKLRSNALLEV